MNYRFLFRLTVVFVVLKLFGAITWSWWWIISPLWIPVVITILFIVIGFLFGAFNVVFKIFFRLDK